MNLSLPANASATISDGPTVGTTTNDDTQAPIVALASGAASSNVTVTFVATSLACNKTYHHRAVGQSNGGTVSASDMTFTSAACPPVGSNNISATTARTP